MERSLTGLIAGALPLADVVEVARPTTWQRLFPLWRHAVWLLALFAVSAAAVAVRLDVQQLRKDLDRNTRLERQAAVLNERLRLEIDARRRAVAVEGVAHRLELTTHAQIVRVPETR